MSATTQNHQPKKLKFTDHLMFNAVLTENEDLCRGLIGAIIGKRVERVEFLENEVSIQPDVDGHGARLDVLALIDGEYADVEMQVGRKPDIARRCRFYHSAIASRYTPKGADYKAVPTSYVIFICLNDPLGDGLPRYELSTRCTNNPTTLVDDGAISILLNAQAWEQEENPEVAGMLHYASTGIFNGGLAERLAKAVDDKNLDRKWVKASMGVMTYEHEIRVLTHDLEDKRTELKKTQAKLEKTQAELRGAQAELEETQAELKGTQAELENVQSSLEATNARLDTLTNLLRGLISEGQISSSSLGDPNLRELFLTEEEQG